MRTVFFGTPAWAVPSLEALLEAGEEIAAVVTNPDRPAGRGMRLRPPPVKEKAAEAGLPVLQPARARDEDLADRLGALAPDICVVVAYGSILPQALLDIPPLGFVNVHFSLLPEYRGAAPVQRAIIDGRSETGISIMILTAGMDEGPILASQSVPIGATDTAETLGARLADVGASLLVRTLPLYGSGRLEPVEQDHDRATYAPKLQSDEARISWAADARRIHDLIRGCHPQPGAWSMLAGKRIKVLSAEPTGRRDLLPGRLASPSEPVVGTATAALRLIEVQMEGKKRMGAVELLRGLRLAEDTRFE